MSEETDHEPTREEGSTRRPEPCSWNSAQAGAHTARRCTEVGGDP